MAKHILTTEEQAAIAQQRAAAYADYSPDGGLPEHWHHIDRKGMGGRRESLTSLRTMGVSARLHYRIHAEGDSVLDDLPARPAFSDLFL
jgi:hypothetical protein